MISANELTISIWGIFLRYSSMHLNKAKNDKIRLNFWNQNCRTLWIIIVISTETTFYEYKRRQNIIPFKHSIYLVLFFLSFRWKMIFQHSKLQNNDH